MPRKVESIRHTEAVSPADRPVAAERDEEIRLRAEVLFRKLGQVDRADRLENAGDEGEDEEPSARGEAEDEVLREQLVEQDAFVEPSEERAQVLSQLGLEGQAPAEPISPSDLLPDQLDRAAMNTAAERFVTLHTSYDYATNSYSVNAASLTRGIKQFIAGPYSVLERIHLIRAVLDAAVKRAPESAAQVNAGLAQLLAREREALEKLRTEPEPAAKTKDKAISSRGKPPGSPPQRERRKRPRVPVGDSVRAAVREALQRAVAEENTVPPRQPRRTRASARPKSAPEPVEGPTGNSGEPPAEGLSASFLVPPPPLSAEPTLQLTEAGHADGAPSEALAPASTDDVTAQTHRAELEHEPTLSLEHDPSAFPSVREKLLRSAFRRRRKGARASVPNAPLPDDEPTLTDIGTVTATFTATVKGKRSRKKSGAKKGR